MSTKYFAKRHLLIETDGLSIELDLAIEFSVSRWRAATLTQPEEPRNCEIERIRTFVCRAEIELPGWLENMIDNAEFKARLLEEASEQDAIAADDEAHARMERQRENAR